MKNLIGFCGNGQCGSNICEKAEKSGYITGIINTSPEDLNSNKLVQNKLKLGNKGGAGNNRNNVKEDVKRFYKEIIEFIKKNFITKGVKIVYLICSSSGGTGSGMTPIIIQVLQKEFPDIVFGCIGVLPDLKEVIGNQNNAIEFLKEISTLNCPIILPDNQKYMDVNKLDKSKQSLFDMMNEEIISYFDEFCEERESSRLGNMDKKDKLEILSTSGITTFSHLSFKDLEVNSKNDLKELILNSLHQNIFTEMEYNNNIIKKPGFIFEVSDKVKDFIDTSLIFNSIGKPIKSFEGVYNSSNSDNYVLSVLTGMKFPKDRILYLKNMINKEKERVATMMEDNDDLFGDVETNWLDGVTKENKNKEEQSIEDILNF